MGWKHLNDTRPKARKGYRCCLCDLPIDKGTVHVARRGVGDNGPVTTRMHIYCESVSRKWEWWEWEDQDPYEFRVHEIIQGITDLNQPRNDERKR